MRKRNGRVLSLNRETVRSLTNDALARAGGAFTTRGDKFTLTSSYTDRTLCTYWGETCRDVQLP